MIMKYIHINDLLLNNEFLFKERVEKTNNTVIKNCMNNKNNLQVSYTETVKKGGRQKVEIEDTVDKRFKLKMQMMQNKDTENAKRRAT